MPDVMLLAVSHKDINELSGGWFEGERIGCDLSQKLSVSPFPADGDHCPEVPFYITYRGMIIRSDIKIHLFRDGKKIFFIRESKKYCSVEIMVSTVSSIDSKSVNQLRKIFHDSPFSYN